MDILSKVKLLLNITDNSKDNILNIIQEQSINMINDYINESELPSELEYIAIEVTISRYNRLGSEGLNSESVLGISQNYITNHLEPYLNQLNLYKKRHNKSFSNSLFKFV